MLITNDIKFLGRLVNDYIGYVRLVHLNCNDEHCLNFESEAIILIMTVIQLYQHTYITRRRHLTIARKWVLLYFKLNIKILV